MMVILLLFKKIFIKDMVAVLHGFDLISQVTQTI